MREPRQLLVQNRLALIFRRVQRVEELTQPAADIAPVRPRSLIDQIEKQIALEDSGVISEQAEHQPHHQRVQVIADVPGLIQLPIDCGNELGCVYIDRVLIAEAPHFRADDEREPLNVLGERGESEAPILAFVQIAQFKALKVAQQQKAGAIGLAESVEVGVGLGSGLRQTASRALLLHQQAARPEEIDVAVRRVQLRHLRFEAGDAAAADAEDLKKLVPEGL